MIPSKCIFQRSSSSINITNLMKTLPKSTGNGPFAASPKIRAIGSQSELSSQPINLISLPSNSLINFTGSVVSIFTPSSQNKFSISNNNNNSHTGSKKLVTQVPVSLVVNIGSLTYRNLATITAAKNGTEKVNDGWQTWEIFAQQNMVGHKQNTPNDYEIMLGYDSSVQLGDKESIFIDKKSLIAIGLSSGARFEIVISKIWRSIFMMNLSRSINGSWRKYSSWKIWKIGSKAFGSLYGQIPVILNAKDKEVVGNYYQNFKAKCIIGVLWIRSSLRIKRDPLVKITGPATVLVKK